MYDDMGRIGPTHLRLKHLDNNLLVLGCSHSVLLYNIQVKYVEIKINFCNLRVNAKRTLM